MSQQPIDFGQANIVGLVGELLLLQG